MRINQIKSYDMDHRHIIININLTDDHRLTTSDKKNSVAMFMPQENKVHC